MKIDHSKFFAQYRVRLEPNLIQTQVIGYEAILKYWEASSMTDVRWLAYALATAYHETGKLIQPVREGFCETDADSIAVVTRMFKQKRISRNYALPEMNGKSYFGRGLVQITFGSNYLKLGKAIGLGTQLYDNPNLVLDLEIAVKILFVGMNQGLFTGARFKHFFVGNKSDWVNARKIINGLDHAVTIGQYAQNFYKCLI